MPTPEGLNSKHTPTAYLQLHIVYRARKLQYKACGQPARANEINTEINNAVLRSISWLYNWFGLRGQPFHGKLLPSGPLLMRGPLLKIYIKRPVRLLDVRKSSATPDREADWVWASDPRLLIIAICKKGLAIYQLPAKFTAYLFYVGKAC